MATQPEEVQSTWERYKPIIAIGIAALALIMLARMFFGSSSSPASNNPKGKTNKPPLSSASSGTKAITDAPSLSPAEIRARKEEYIPTPVVYERSEPPVPEAGRNIFAFYTPPPTPVKTSSPVAVAAATPVPTPAPPPPLILASVSPANVYARTGDFTLEVTGDKFTPAVRINIDGRELPTRFISPQQLSATVPASLIAGDGARQVKVQTPDGALYSNTATLNVQAPPVPNYTYVGIIGGPRYNDTAVLKDKTSNDLLNVQRGDLVGGRFRVTSISERELVLTDTTLRGVKHTLAFTGDAASNNNPSGRSGPTPATRPVQSDDDEP